jgi:hypothetical protein
VRIKPIDPTKQIKKDNNISVLKRAGTMGLNEKTLKSIQNAMMYFKNLADASSNGDENSFADNLWHLTAELEYMLFLLSITFQNDNESEKWKPDPEMKTMETESILANLRSLLSDVEKLLLQGNLREAYRAAYTARHYVLKIRDNLTRKKREALKRKQ